MTSRITEKLQQELHKRTRKSDSRFFTTTKRGELHELKEDLNSSDKDRQKSAVKKIIAMMTLGRDVSQLFTDVVKLSRTTNMEIKKLVYLYIMANAKLQPDKAILAVNTFVQDTQNESPIIRALAIRTMLCVRVANVTDYCCPPLRGALKDKDPYVRKTAVLGVVKMFHTDPKLCEEQDFLNELQALVSDSVPSVVANVVLALTEIMENSSHSFPVTGGLVSKLLNALEGCSEWGQVAVLDFISRYRAKADEAESIIARVIPRLQHVNASVVLSAIRCIVRNLGVITDDEKRRTVSSKLSPPLVTLMLGDPETQFITLRNIQIIIQKYPQVLAKEVKVFFCKYTDPAYVKLEKLKVLMRLLTEKNADILFRELEEYSGEVDPVFVRRSILAIGSCGVKLASCSQKALALLRKLAKEAKAPQILSNVLVAAKDILRKHPTMSSHFFDGEIVELLDAESLDPEGSLAMLWFAGEYSGELNAREYLDYYVRQFHDLTAPVQLALLTSTVKVFLKSSTANEDILQTVLQKATTETENPDLRDRAYMYWRLLSNEKHASMIMNFMVGQKKPPVRADTDELDESWLNELIPCLNTLASVYHKPPSSFIHKYGYNAAKENMQDDLEEEEEEVYDEDEKTSANDSPVSPDTSSPIVESRKPKAKMAAPQAKPAEPVPVQKKSSTADLDAIFGLVPSPSPSQDNSPVTSSNPMDMFFGTPAPAPTQQEAAPSHPELVPAGKGLQIWGGLERSGDTLSLQLRLKNCTQQPMGSFAIQFNTNPFGIKNAEPMGQLQIPPGGTSTVSVPCVSRPEHINMQNESLQIAIKNNQTTYYFTCECPMYKAFVPHSMQRKEFIQKWQSLPDSNEVAFSIPAKPNFRDVLSSANINFVANRVSDGQETLYYGARTMTNSVLLIEIVIQPNELLFSVKADNMYYAQRVEQSVRLLM